MRRQLCLVVLALAAATLTAGCSGSGGTKAGGSEAAVTLRIGTDDSPGVAPADQIQEFARRVEKLSGGKLRIEPVWHASGPRGLREWDQRVARKVVGGELDLGLIPARAWDTEGVASLRALHAPFLITSDELLNRVVSSELAERMLAGLERADVVGLALLPETLRHPFAYREPLLSPADYAGIVVRSPRSKTSYALFEALGAKGDDPNEDEFRAAIATGSVAAAESDFARAGSLQADTIATGNVTFYPKVESLVVNADVFERLDDDERRILEDAAVQTRDWAIRAMPSEVEALRSYCRTGGRVVLASEADLAALKEAAAPVYAELERDEATRSMIEGIRALASGLATSITVLPAPCGAAGERPASGRGTSSVLDGVYRTSFTRAVLHRSPLLYDAGEVNDENWGDFTLTLRDGRVQLDQENNIASSSTSGAFSIDGDTVVFEFTEGGNYGETFEMQWRLDGDTLVFERDAALGVAPTPYLIEAWRRDPSRQESSFPEGVYRVSLSLEFLRGRGLSPATAYNAVGINTLTFVDGTWRHHLENASNPHDCTGKYAVADGRVSLRVGAGVGPYGCGSEGLEIFSAHWRLEGGELRFLDVDAKFDDFFAETAWGGKPWRKIG